MEDKILYLLWAAVIAASIMTAALCVVLWAIGYPAPF